MAKELTPEILKELAKPFAVTQYRAQQVSRDGKRALAVAFCDRADVIERLNEVVPADWEFTIPNIYPEMGERGTWASQGRLTICGISREDIGCADKHDPDPPKSAATDAFKRAATHFGIGAYLYRLPMEWCDVRTYKTEGGSWVVDEWLTKPSWAKSGQIKAVPRVERDAESASPPSPTPPTRQSATSTGVAAVFPGAREVKPPPKGANGNGDPAKQKIDTATTKEIMDRAELVYGAGDPARVQLREDLRGRYGKRMVRDLTAGEAQDYMQFLATGGAYAGVEKAGA